MKKFLVLNLLILISLVCFGQKIPAGYYDNTYNTGGEALKTALYNIIKGHTEFEYTSDTTDVWDILKETDKDTVNAENVIMLYTGDTLNAEAEWNSGNGWTREHVWAKSRGIHDNAVSPDILPGAATDAHNLRACEGNVNSIRNNRWFAECTIPFVNNGVETGGFTGGTDAWVWKPRPEVKGDVARMMFYMAARYEGEGDEPDLMVVDYFPANNSDEPKHALFTDLLNWHLEDPVDDYERNRNDVVYSFQGNRNPFIDNPEWIEHIWDNDFSEMWFTSVPDTETTDREPYTYNISAMGGDAVLSITEETIPNWLTFTAGTSQAGNATATLTGSPTFSDIGTYSVLINLTDGTTTLPQSFDIVVSDGNPITFTSEPLTRAYVEQEYLYEITATGAAGAIFNISGDFPDWLSLSNSTLPATLNGTPQIANIGEHNITLTLTDDRNTKKTITQEFVVLVVDPNDVNTVIITQYYEGSSGSNKYIEITNIGDETVDFTDYHLARWGTTGTPSGSYDTNGSGAPLTGTIDAGETRLYKHSNAATPVYAVSVAIPTTACYFNGDDPVAILRNGDTWDDRVDCIYSATISPKWGESTSFYRKQTVTVGNRNESIFDGSGEWVEVTETVVNNASSTMQEYLGFYVDHVTKISEISSEVKLYPNPASDILFIESANVINKIEVYSVTGQKLKQLIFDNTKIEINISELENGFYFLTIIDGNGKISTKKFVKE